MAGSVYYRFKSSTVVETILIDGPFIPVRYLKEKLIERIKVGKGNDIVLINPETDEEYINDETLIHQSSTVLIRRVPRRYLLPIVLAPVEEEDQKEEKGSPSSVQTLENSSSIVYPEDSEWDDFVAKELNSSSDNSESQSKSVGSGVVNNPDEDSKVAAVVQGFNRRAAPPPPGYVCHRCNIPGHLIQHCSTNGDPNFDVKRLKRPIGIPISMLVPSQDGSYSLPTGVTADMKPNKAVFEKEIEGVPVRNSVVDLPPELHCPLCKNPMKDAVFTSKCCFRSFCDRCIRDYIIAKSMCDCGAKGVLADDLLPNPTLRDTINRMLWSDHSSNSSGRSSSSSNKSGVENNTSQIQPSRSSGGGSSSSSRKEETCRVPETVQKKLGPTTEKVANVSDTINVTVSVNDSLTNEKEIEHNVPVSSELLECKKSKKNNDVKKQRRSAENVSACNSNENSSNGYGPGPYAYNQFWNPYMSPYVNNHYHPYMGYGVAPMNTLFDTQNYMMPPSRPQSHRGAVNMKRKREDERCRGY